MEYIKNKGLNRIYLKEIKRTKKEKRKELKLLKNSWIKPKYHYDSHIKSFKKYYTEILKNYYILINNQPIFKYQIELYNKKYETRINIAKNIKSFII